MKKAVALLLAIGLIGCATFKLERQLAPDIKAWYRTHSILMQSKTPKWLNSHKRSESYHFLRMPERIQRKWMAMFWDIRAEGANWLFYDRLEYAKRHFHRDDRERTFLINGSPDFVYYYRHGDPNSYWGNPSDSLSTRYVIWRYYRHNIFAEYCFKVDFGRYRTDMTSARGMGEQRYFEQRNLEMLAPTPEGWLELESMLYLELGN